jgi:hypothetical protein
MHIKLVIFALFLSSSADCFLLMRQRCVAAGNGLSTGLSTTIEYVRHTASGAAGKVSASRSSTCDAQETAPRAAAWAPRPITRDKQLPRAAAWPPRSIAYVASWASTWHQD